MSDRAAVAGLAGRDLLDIDDLTPAELAGLVGLALDVKADRAAGASALSGCAVGLLLEKPSTRTRVSFEAAVAQLGGHPLVLRPDELQIGRGETVGDTGRVLDRYLDLLEARVLEHASLEELASVMAKPVVNALSDRAHPLQAIADVMTLAERGIGSVAYVGDGNNVAHSLMLACAASGIDVRLATPGAYSPDPVVAAKAGELAAASGSGLLLTSSPGEAVDGAGAVYTDVWVSMGDEAEADARKAALEAYRIDERLMEKAAPGAVALHCLPAHRGQEISAEVIDGPASAVWDQAENRLHAQKAVLIALVGGVL